MKNGKYDQHLSAKHGNGLYNKENNSFLDASRSGLRGGPSPARSKLLGSAFNESHTSVSSSPQRSSKIYEKLREGKYNYEQTKQMLLARQQQFKKKDKLHNMGKATHRDMKKLNNMVSNNTKYLSVPGHGDVRRSDTSATDRNKLYAVRSDKPVVIPSRITDIPAQLARRYTQIDDNEIIFEGELMKYKPGINT